MTTAMNYLQEALIESTRHHRADVDNYLIRSISQMIENLILDANQYYYNR